MDECKPLPAPRVPPRLATKVDAKASATAEGLADIARHIKQRELNPRPLNEMNLMVPYDVASIICQAQRTLNPRFF